jgi:hypothetical protein
MYPVTIQYNLQSEYAKGGDAQVRKDRDHIEFALTQAGIPEILGTVRTVVDTRRSKLARYSTGTNGYAAITALSRNGIKHERE